MNGLQHLPPLARGNVAIFVVNATLMLSARLDRLHSHCFSSLWYYLTSTRNQSLPALVVCAQTAVPLGQLSVIVKSIEVYPSHRNMGNMAMSFPGNLTCLWEISRSNIFK